MMNRRVDDWETESDIDALQRAEEIRQDRHYFANRHGHY